MLSILSKFSGSVTENHEDPPPFKRQRTDKAFSEEKTAIA